MPPAIRSATAITACADVRIQNIAAMAAASKMRPAVGSTQRQSITCSPANNTSAAADWKSCARVSDFGRCGNQSNSSANSPRPHENACSRIPATSVNRTLNRPNMFRSICMQYGACDLSRINVGGEFGGASESRSSTIRTLQYSSATREDRRRISSGSFIAV